MSDTPGFSLKTPKYARIPFPICPNTPEYAGIILPIQPIRQNHTVRHM
jgi:hypothetical protein